MMNKLLRSLLVIILAVSSATSLAYAEQNDTKSKRILFIGDSITYAGQYVNIIETQMRLQHVQPLPEIFNVGLNSETCTGLTEPDHPFPRPNVHDRLEQALAKTKPDLVYACYGMNDGIYYPFSEKRFQAYQQGINKLIKKVHAHKAELVLITPPPFDAYALKGKEGKLLPAGQEKYAYFAIYENYDQEVIKRYGKWIMQQKDRVKQVIDIHTPISAHLAETRKTKPDYTITTDGVHPTTQGHLVIAKAILKALEIESFIEPSAELNNLMTKRGNILRSAWLSDIGHKRPGVPKGLPIAEATKKAKLLEEKIILLVKKESQPVFSKRQTSTGIIYQIHYPASQQLGKLKIAVDYYLWIPQGVKKIRGIIVHQHGCGAGSAIGGKTVADDLHWQSLAKKWDCALMGSSYEAPPGASCRLWCDPRNGSDARFIQAISHFAAETDHEEIGTSPWCIWGHSGGGFWASLMQTKYPQRIVAIWLQSGTAYGYWMKGDCPVPKFFPGTYNVPVMGNPGLKEKGHARFKSAWQGTVAMRKAYLEKGAPFFEFAPDPRTGHECGDSRYLSIPFFDFWLAHRLVPVKQLNAGSFDLLKPTADAVADWKREMQPKLQEFIKTGTINDLTPPASPHHINAKRLPDGSIEITWNAEADFESGIKAFVVEREGQKIAQLPETPKNHYGKPLYQGMTYGDTPAAPLPVMKYIDKTAPEGAIKRYSIRTINTAGLMSP